MEDSAIITMFLERDPEAVHAISEKYGAYCKSIAMNILSDPQDAEECINDAYLQLWRSIPPHQPENLATYLGKLLRNITFNRYRANQTQKRGEGNIPLVLDELAEVVTGGDSPESAVEAKEMSQAINAFLGKLPAWKRYVMVRRYWYADSTAQIARACGRSEGYVSLTLTRLRRKLHAYLTERGFEL